LSNTIKGTERIQQCLDEWGINFHLLEFPQSTRTAQEAAEAIGCQLGQIAKSIVFKTKSSEKPVLVIASGVNRIDEKKIKHWEGEKVEKADADFTLAHTGYVIGGIPPVGHLQPITTYIDEDLFNYTHIWAAAGTPHSVFQLTPQQLKQITRGQVTCIKK